MEKEGRTVILSTPEELLPLITEAVRAARYEDTADDGGRDDKKLLAPRDIEKEFGIPRRTLGYWRTMGIGPAFISFGKKVFYQRPVIEEFIASGRVNTIGYIDE